MSVDPIVYVIKPVPGSLGHKNGQVYLKDCYTIGKMSVNTSIRIERFERWTEINLKVSAYFIVSLTRKWWKCIEQAFDFTRYTEQQKKGRDFKICSLTSFWIMTVPENPIGGGMRLEWFSKHPVCKRPCWYLVFIRRFFCCSVYLSDFRIFYKYPLKLFLKEEK